MKRRRFRRTPGLRAVASALALAATSLLGGCIYGFTGGGGFPAAIKTVCIEPFDNQTDHTELTNQLFTALTQKVPGALGLRLADCKGGADAIIRGKILRYDDSAASYTASPAPGVPAQNLQNKVTVTVGVQIIDTKRNVLLWESSGVNGDGTYQPPNDTQGRKDAVDKLVTAIVDGAQSQW